MRKSLHTCSLCLHRWRVPQFALKYPCNPPPPGRPSLGDRLPPPPGRPSRANPGVCQGGAGYPPPPCRSPPLVVPRGRGGGPSLGQPKSFRYGSLRCCVGDCVVGYCHLYPLYSWQDILLTFAEWNLTAQPCFPLGQMRCSSALRGNLFWHRSLDAVLGTSCILQGAFPKGNGFPKICLRLPSGSVVKPSKNYFFSKKVIFTRYPPPPPA